MGLISFMQPDAKRNEVLKLLVYFRANSFKKHKGLTSILNLSGLCLYKHPINLHHHITETDVSFGD